MQAFLYLKIRILINGIKQLKEKPSKLISALMYLGLLSLVFLIPRGTSDSSELDFAQSDLAKFIMSMIFFGILLLINSFTWYSGTKRGVSIFTLPDTQFLFTAPLKPATILLYGMLNQLKTSLISTIFLLYQIPNLRRFGLSTNQTLALFGVWFLCIFSNHIISAFIYAISFKSSKSVNIIEIIIYAFPIITVLIGFAYILRESDALTGLVAFVNSKLLYLIPEPVGLKGL